MRKGCYRAKAYGGSVIRHTRELNVEEAMGMDLQQFTEFR
jgi:hypothetical protein